MRRPAITLSALAAMVVGAGLAQAQVPYLTYYQPSTGFYSPPATSSYVTRSYVTSPTVTYYSSPPGYTYYSPYPRTTYYYSPGYAYYSTPTVTRYRPFFGGTVSRYITGYAPTYYSYAY